MTTTMHRAELIEELARSLRGDKQAAEVAINALFGDLSSGGGAGIIPLALKRGDEVIITGFGTFRRVKVGLRDVVPPRQGMVVQPGMSVNEHYRAAFRAGDTLARLVWPDKPPASTDDWPEVTP